MEKIGNVVLNDRFYKGTDAYSDGDIEEKMLQIVRQEDSYEDRLMRENEWALLYHLSPSGKTCWSGTTLGRGKPCWKSAPDAER